MPSLHNGMWKSSGGHKAIKAAKKTIIGDKTGGIRISHKPGKDP
ncbi:hypothetical protein [Rahnella inusitata]